MGVFFLTRAMDRIFASGARNVIEAATDTLSAGDVVVAAPGSGTALVLEDGNRFDLSAPRTLSGVDAVIDRSVGDSVITLRDGLDVTLQLGRDTATVYGAENADTIIGGGSSYDTIFLGSARESVIAGAAGATVVMDAAEAGARIAGDGVTTLRLTGHAGDAVRLGRGVEGVSALDVTGAGMRVDARAAGVGSVVLSASGTALTVGAQTATVTDFAGGNAVRFTAPGQTLVLPDAGVARLAADHVSLVAGDAIDVDLPFGAGETVGYDASSGTLSVVEARSGASAVVELTPGARSFAVSADRGIGNGDTGTLITFGAGAPGTEPEPPAPCFGAGTRVLTGRGWEAVEQLKIGDQLITLAGVARTLRWIGFRTVDCRRHAAPEAVHPIRVCAGAFGEDLPQRDVLLSPDHALFIDGALVPVKYLVNGANVRQEAVETVRYFHLELSSHDVIVADGLPVETYLDAGNRHQFANGAAHIALHPDFSTRADAPRRCAALVIEGPIVRSARARLLARADAGGWRITQDADLHVEADGQRIWGRHAGGVWSGWIPPGTRRLCVVSRASAPADCRLDSDDRRRLGVALAGVTLIAKGEARRLQPHDAWGPGFHAPESDRHACWRWSNGRGELPPALWAGIAGPFRLDLQVEQTLTYRLAEDVTGLVPMLELEAARRLA